MLYQPEAAIPADQETARQRRRSVLRRSVLRRSVLRLSDSIR